MKKITFEEAKKLNQNFVKTRSKAIDSAIGKNDAVSSWFSLDELKEYIAYVEEQGKLKKIDVTGLRVYFGAYNNSEKEGTKKDLTTVFIVPTQKNEKLKGKVGGDNSDITDIDGLNGGGLGYPPSAVYPQ
ncbi:hypothetical protein [Lutibacter sp.]|uniref:hypothetical protein n=1 Tax=Lutibacter sp. TaxID=1925666 RepID=UPI003564415F